MIRLLGNTYLAGRRLRWVSYILLSLRDLLLRPILTVSPTTEPLLRDVQQICVAKPDYLGDILMITPTLRALREAAPQAKILLVAGEWTRPLVEFLRDHGVVDEVACLNLAMLDRSARGLLQKIADEIRSRSILKRTLRNRRVDLFFDLRPYSPNSWSVGVMSKAHFRVGFGLRGMAFTYHRLIPFDVRKPVGQLFLDGVLPPYLAPEYRRPCLPSAIGQARKVLPPEVTGPYLVVQLFSGEASRNVASSVWMQIVEVLRTRFAIVLAGSGDDAAAMQRQNQSFAGGHSLLGKTTIPELLRLVEESSGVISVDSFCAHLALAYGKRAAVLYVDGTTDPRSFPSENPDLRFFFPTAGSSQEILEFLAAGTPSTET